MEGNKKKFYQIKIVQISFALFFAAALSILFYFIMDNAGDRTISFGKFISAIRPFIYGAIIAYLLVPLCNGLEKLLYKILSKKKDFSKKESENFVTYLSIFLGLFIAVIIIYVLLSMIIPQLIVSLTVIVNNFDSYYDNITKWLNEFFKSNSLLHDYAESITTSLTDTAEKWLKTELLPNAKTILSNVSSSVLGVFSILKNIFIGLIVSIYVLASRRKFAAQAKIFVHAVFKEHTADKIIKEIQFSNKMFLGFISGRLLDSAIIAVLCFIGLSLLRMPYPLLISVVVGVTNIIPFFGPFIGGIPAGFIILMVSPIKCLWFAIFIVILQQIDGNIIGPKIVGELTNLNSFWVLFAIMVFSGLFGFVGMLVGVPVFAVIYHLAQELIMRGLKRTGYVPTPKDAEVSLLNDYLEKTMEEELEATLPADSKPGILKELFYRITGKNDDIKHTAVKETTKATAKETIKATTKATTKATAKATNKVTTKETTKEKSKK